jgi:hypothetical protein
MKKIMRLWVLFLFITGSEMYANEKKEETGADVSKITIPFMDYRYSKFKSTIILRTAEDLDYFLKATEYKDFEMNNSAFKEAIKDPIFLKHVEDRRKENEKANIAFKQAIKDAIFNENVDFNKHNIVVIPIIKGSGSISIRDQEPIREGDNIVIPIISNSPAIQNSLLAYYGLAYKVKKGISKIIFDSTTIENYMDKVSKYRWEVQINPIGSNSKCLKHDSKLASNSVISKLEIPIIIPYEIRDFGQHTFIESGKASNPFIYLKSEEDLKLFLKKIESQSDWKENKAFKDAIISTNLDFSIYDLVLISKIANFFNNNAATESFSVEDLSPDWEGQNIKIYIPHVNGKVWTSKTVAFAFAYKIKKGIPKVIIEDRDRVNRYELQNTCT